MPSDSWLAALAPPHPDQSVLEPHSAIDPADPRRVAVVATYPGEVRGLGRNIWCWTTSDAGLTWHGGRIVQAKFDGEGAADPLVGYGADGALIAVAMTLPKDYVDSRVEAMKLITRLTAPTVEERRDDHAGQLHIHPGRRSDMICIARSEDQGRTWSSTIVPNSPSGDKTALAIDHRSDSPHRGNLYVAWNNTATHQVTFARSVDGGRKAESAITIGGRNGANMIQIAVGLQGAVHLLWSVGHGWLAPNPDHPQAATAIFHSRSDNSGVTFSDPVVVAEHAGTHRAVFGSLAVTTGGDLLAVYTEADAAVPKRGMQARTTIRWIHSKDGERWSNPAPLTDLAPNMAQGLPAVTATSDAWHVLSYDADPTTTTVRIYSAGLRELKFRATREIAARNFGSSDVWLQGSYPIRLASDIAFVGDYVGLASADSQLAVAIVLPEDDDWRSATRAYAGIHTTER